FVRRRRLSRGGQERSVALRGDGRRRNREGPPATCPRLQATRKGLNPLHRQEGNRFPPFRCPEGGDGLNFWDRQNRADRGCPGGPCGNQAGGRQAFRPMASETISGLI